MWLRRLKKKTGLSLLTIGLLASASSCGHGNTSIPVIQIKTWKGDHREGAITRPTSNELISCRDSQIDGYTCMTYADMKKIMELLVQCKDWGVQQKTMPLEDILFRNEDVYEAYGRKVGY